MTLRTIVVDDEPLARELLGALLAEHEDIHVVSQCQDGEEAISYLQAKPVDLMFLDVQMPETGGFDVVERLGLQHLPPTVFVTAYHEHAVKAFDVHAVDYLTKPVTSERLATALERVRRKIAAETALLTQEQLTAVLSGLLGAGSERKSYPSRFLVKDGEKGILLSSETIDWVEAADYYCCLHVGNRGYMLRESIADLGGKLDPNQFVRIHRSSIVNLDQIREIHRDGQTAGSVVLANGRKLRMSRSGRQKLMELGKT
jgi:two-component system, LytTR family, response regulator